MATPDVGERLLFGLKIGNVRGVGSSDPVGAARIAAGDEQALAEVDMSGSEPDERRARVIAASSSARGAGRAMPSPPAISAVEAFTRAADAFDAVLASLSDEQWQVPALRDLSVQGLVGHLCGVERDTQRALGGDASVADADHVAATQDLADAQSGVAPAETLAAWRVAVDQTLVALAEARLRLDEGAVLSVYGMQLPMDALLVVRAFELWTHENDIRRVVGLAPSAPEPSTLALMTELAARLLPHAVKGSGSLAARGVASAVDLHLVLWDLPLGSGADRRDVMIVTDAVDFCRLVANRLEPEALAMHVDGDMEDVRGVLVAAATLALD